jgi:23S rRNA pseudouridine955/2504/2580 synthase
MTRNRPIKQISARDAEFAKSLLIYADAHILVFNKPSGVATQGGGGVTQSLDDLSAAFAKSNGKKPHLVHRLDQGTSGAIVMARTQPAAAFLSEEFATRRARKTYIALVSGALPTVPEGTVAASVVKVEEGGRPRMIIARPGRKGAQAAVTHWRIIAKQDQRAVVELRPETGRMHQIRLHLAHLGMPILGDPLYGEGAASAPRLMLHAAQLTINHPDGRAMQFDAPVPENMDAMRRAIAGE